MGINGTCSRGNFNVVSMLNMKYIIADQELQMDPLETVYRGSQFIMKNSEYLPRMWFVDRARVISDPDQHLAALADPAWQPGTEALVFEDVGPLDRGAGGTAVITKLGFREILAMIQSPGNCLLVISEVYYKPGWTAWLDGEPVDILRTNYLLRGIKVPPGPHTLRMRFDPPVFKYGFYLSSASYFLIAVSLAFSFLRPRWKRFPPETAAVKV